MTLRHRELLAQAIEACATREHFSPFPDRPGRDAETEASIAAGRTAYERWPGSSVDLAQPTRGVLEAREVSPYTGQPLGISYPRTQVDDLFAASTKAADSWRSVPAEQRVDLCLEIVQRLYGRWFEIAYANQHTTGQSFSMSCIGSGTNALDRGIEAVAYAASAMGRVPDHARWEKDFGRTRVRLDKRYRILPRGTAVVITCASFPTWNAYPALLVNLATGNPAIVKPHPTSVLTMAMAVQTAQQVLAEAGLPPEIVQLAVDEPERPVAKELIGHPGCAIVDFTGSPSFGSWIEANAHPAISFTETAGVNTVVLESTEDLDATLGAVATSLSLFTAQMCTSVQNLYVPRSGVHTPEGTVGLDEVVDRLVGAVDDIAARPHRAAGVLGAVQAPSTVEQVRRLENEAARLGEVARPSGEYSHPEFPDARTATPSIAVVDPGARTLFGEERFGPSSFVIACDDADDALAQALTDVRARGAIASHLYTTDPAFADRGVEGYLGAGASLTCNLTGPMPLNFAAAYSDYHVTGLSPAGNACLTDEAFVAGRFRIAQVRQPASDV